MLLVAGSVSGTISVIRVEVEVEPPTTTGAVFIIIVVIIIIIVSHGSPTSVVRPRMQEKRIELFRNSFEIGIAILDLFALGDTRGSRM